MVHAVRRIVTIQPGGRVAVTDSNLPAGAEAEVIVLVNAPLPKINYAEVFGSGRGAFANPTKADAFMCAERDAWDE